MKLQFIGATGTVTGSKTWVECGGSRLLVDCGLFQGVKVLRNRNREPFGFDVQALDAMVLTHAHLDHSGMLPVLVRDGFKGPIYCTSPTADLLEIMLRDSGRIQEEDAAYAKRKGFSRHANPEPLYTEKDAIAALARVRPIPFDEEVKVGETTVTFRRAAHIIGAASIVIEHAGKRVVFSGDVGRPHDPLLPPPVPPEDADLVVMESTYGNREHQPDPEGELARIITETAGRGGTLLIPSFAVGRTQSLLFHIDKIFDDDGGLRLPVYVNSPMATAATQVFLRHPEAHALDAEACDAAFRTATYVASVEASKALNRKRGPLIIIAASGMLTGGRVLHHIKSLAPDAKNTILLAGHQAEGTRGARLLGGDRRVKIHGQYVTVRAKVQRIDGLSAHADQGELIDWLRGAKVPPRRVVLNHGEPDAADVLRLKIEDELGIDVHVADRDEVVTI